MKNILILNGSPRKNGKTASLMKALIEGAKENNNKIKEHYITSRFLGWEDLGTVLGAGREEEAKAIGAGIK